MSGAERSSERRRSFRETSRPAERTRGMTRTNVSALVAAAVLGCATAAAAALPPAPSAQRVPVTDTYFGTSVVDPYRWMETGGPDFQAFLKAHNDRTRAVLDSIPGRAAF